MEKKIFMKVLNTREELDAFRKKLNEDPDCTYQFTQPVPLEKKSPHTSIRLVVIYVHDNEVE